MSQQENISVEKCSIEKVKDELACHMENINDFVAKLNSLLTEVEIVQAISFQIPQYDFGDESAPVNFLSVNALHDDDSLKAATETFKKFYCVDGKSRKAVYRNPGIIVVNSHDVELKDTIIAINNHKLSFKKSVLKLGKSQKLRHDTVHELFPMLNTKQLYRRINYIDAMDTPIVQASFSWTTRPGITKTDKTKMKKKLDAHKKQIPQGVCRNEWLRWIELEKDTINLLPDDLELRIKRPTKLFPIVNLKDSKEDTSQKQTSMPMIIFQSSPIKIRPLPDYEKRTRSSRSDLKISNTPIIERLSLFSMRDT